MPLWLHSRVQTGVTCSCATPGWSQGPAGCQGRRRTQETRSPWGSYLLDHLSSVTQSCPTLCNPMDCSTPGLPVHHQIPELTQTRVHRVSDAIQPSHPLLSPPPPALSLSQHQGLFKCVSSSHQVAEISELQLQHQSFQ